MKGMFFIYNDLVYEVISDPVVCVRGSSTTMTSTGSGKVSSNITILAQPVDGDGKCISVDPTRARFYHSEREARKRLVDSRVDGRVGTVHATVTALKDLEALMKGQGVHFRQLTRVEERAGGGCEVKIACSLFRRLEEGEVPPVYRPTVVNGVLTFDEVK
jgi:hypothetical protein